MKLGFFFVSLSLLASCQSKPILKEKQEKDVYAKVYENCRLTPKEFGGKYLQNEIKLKDFNICDSLLLAVVNKLSDNNVEEKLFWFAVLSKMLPETDGYLSEGFGVEAHDFIKNNPIQFSKNILAVGKEFPIEKNLQNWADEIIGEIKISDEGNEKKAVSTYIKALKLKMLNIKTEEKSVLDSFCKKLKTQFLN